MSTANLTDITPRQIAQAMSITAAVAQTIYETSPTPHGPLYAAFASVMPAAHFNKIILLLTNASLIEERHHQLYWIGPPMIPGE